MSKRRRTESSGFHSAKRPIDKNIVVINTQADTTQVAVTLITATFPCTATGIRWEIGALNTNALANTLWWAIVLIKDGSSVPVLSTGNASQFFQPEQNCLSFGHSSMDLVALSNTTNSSGSTKTMRKLMGGDKLVFLAKAGRSDIEVTGQIQIFCKT